MKRKNIALVKTILSVVFVTLVFCACSKLAINDDDNGGPNDECLEPVLFKGWGTCAFDEPEGTPLSLPEGLIFIAAEQPRTDEETDSCRYKFDDDPHSWDVGFSVILCVSFRNATDKPLKLVLPPGLIFVSRDPFGQNGILMQRVAVEVPANTVVYNQLNMHCINGSKRRSGDVDLPYNLGPVTNVKPALELIAFLNDRDIRMASNQVKGAIGIACSDITDEGLIRESTWEILKTF